MPETQRTIWRQAQVITVLVVVAGALAIALVALLTSNSTASCVNDTLGDRAPITSADNGAQRQIADAFNALLTIDPNLSAGQRVAEVDRIKAEVARANATFRADQAARAKHPLGHC